MAARLQEPARQSRAGSGGDHESSRMKRLARIASMNAPEILWRGRAAGRMALGRIRARVAAPRWRRRDLARVLAPMPELAPVRAALRARRWNDAHRLLSQHFAQTVPRFAIG